MLILKTRPVLKQILLLQVQFGPCPAVDQVCPYKNCPANGANMCSAQGECYNKRCYCPVDKAGVDCSLSVCQTSGNSGNGTALTCVEGQDCSELNECTWNPPAPAPPPPSDPLAAGNVRPTVPLDIHTWFCDSSQR